MPGSRGGASWWVRWVLGFLGFTVALLRVTPAAAEPPIAIGDVPPDLKPWVPWVLDGAGAERCPRVGGERQCFWFGQLALDVTDQGASFRLAVDVDHYASVPLPGSVEYWPQEVHDGATPVAVLGGTSPALSLAPGKHELAGRIFWAKAPEALPIPASIGLVTLRLRGQEVTQPRRDKPESVWLGRSEAAAPEEPERVDVEVFRRLSDGAPFRIESQIVVRVSGRAREVALGRPLLAGSRPLDLDAKLPVRLDESGMLFAQVRAGEHVIRLVSLLARPPDEIAAAVQSAPWPEQEIWTWVADPEQRQVQVSGLPGIDPARTNLPVDWREAAAYLASGDAKLVLTTVQRGRAEPPPNELNLTRELWLDSDGRAFTVSDELEGTMNRGWRLELGRGELGRVRVGQEDQVITVGASGYRGVEVRSGEVKVLAEWRLPVGARAAIPVAGWSEDLDSASIQLHLPPGWRLLGVLGPYEASDTWLAPWNLFGLVYVLVVALAMGRMTRWYWGVTALVAMVLCHEYAAAPYVVWGVLLVALALLRALGRGIVRRLVAGAAALPAVVLLGSGVVFVSAQLHFAAFPDLDVPDGRYVSGWRGPLPVPIDAEEWEQEEKEREQIAEEKPDNREGGTGTRAKGEEGSMGNPNAKARNRRYAVAGPRDNPLQQQLDVNSVVQTGPGIPKWTGTTHQIGEHQGPTARDATIRLLLLSPWQAALLALLRVVAFLAFTYALVTALIRAQPRASGAASSAAKGSSRSAVVASLFVASVLATLAGTRPSAAELPSSEQLTELRQRLTRGGDCGDACLSVPNLALTLRGSEVSLSVEVHAGEPTAVPLPGPASSWVPRRISVDGQTSSSVVLRNDGYLYVRLEPGRHRVELDGPVAGSDLTLTLGTPARWVTVDAEGWEVDGVQDGHIEGSLHLARAAAPSPSGAEASASPATRAALPPWLEIHRFVELGVKWKIRTQVVRASSPGEPLAIKFPLLPGEEVTESSLVTDRGGVLLSFARDAKELSFASVLKPVPSLTLVAAKNQPWSETWTVDCSPLWHCELGGIAPYRILDGRVYRPQFRPWPGERVSIAVVRPGPAPGASTTIDSAQLSLSPTEGTLSVELELRTSTGGIRELVLPAEAKPMALRVRGEDQPLRVRDGKLSFVVTPGIQSVTVEAKGLTQGMLVTAPEVRVGEAVNAKTTIYLEGDRFPILTHGSGRGGVVLLWGVMLLLAMAALGLSYLPFHRLARWEWVALALGFALVPWPLLIPVAGWFFLVGWRETWRGPATFRKNLAQASIVLATLAAGAVVLLAVRQGLVDSPKVLLTGGGSSNGVLVFAVDRILPDGALPRPSVLLAPNWLWRLVALGWTVWLALLLRRVGRQAWTAFQRDGVLGPWWRSAAPAVASGLPDVADLDLEPPVEAPAAAAEHDPVPESDTARDASTRSDPDEPGD